MAVTFVIGCGQDDVLGDTCVECGGWLSRVVVGGIPAELGFVCDEQCAVDQSARLAELERDRHLRVRDLLCACPQYCAPAGLPSAEHLAEYTRFREEASHGQAK
jgi:hypothetical protein